MTLSLGPNLGLLVDGAAGEGHYAQMMALLRGLDALVMPRVLSVGANTAPGSPSDGDMHVVGTSPTGVWAGKANNLARRSAVAGAWEFFAPKPGWRVSDSSNAYSVLTFNGTSWITPMDQACIRAIGGAPPTTGVGVELAFANGSPGTGYLTSYDRSGAIWQKLALRALDHEWLCSGTSRMTLSNAGLLTCAGGINFGQQDLKNYSEGTWSPVLIGTTGSAGAYAATVAVGTYVRIGRFVYATAYIVLNNKGSWTGNVRLSGLPFTVMSVSNAYQSGAIGFYSNITMSGGNTQLGTYGRTGETACDLLSMGSASSGALLDYGTAIANNTNLLLGLMFQV